MKIRKTTVFILTLFCLIVAAEGISAQNTPTNTQADYESAPFSTTGLSEDSLLQTNELPVKQITTTEDLRNTAQIVGGSNLMNRVQANRIAGHPTEGIIKDKLGKTRKSKVEHGFQVN